MDKKVINTKEAPAPIGPYQQAILAGNTLYISGQISIDVETDQLIKGDIQAETHQVMKNLKAILSAADMAFDNVIKSSIFVTDINNFGEVNNIYGKYF
ncbi:MAG TPA: Rid family detoxifying hydrolase, partial [Chitinophagaceae bacterium]|nr:Rid family detoxifying hydrolase [Chitinophagaceae bacterium]